MNISKIIIVGLLIAMVLVGCEKKVAQSENPQQEEQEQKQNNNSLGIDETFGNPEKVSPPTIPT